MPGPGKADRMPEDPKPQWRSLPAMTPGVWDTRTYGNFVAPPVFRSLRVIRPMDAVADVFCVEALEKLMLELATEANKE